MFAKWWIFQAVRTGIPEIPFNDVSTLKGYEDRVFPFQGDTGDMVPRSCSRRLPFS